MLHWLRHRNLLGLSTRSGKILVMRFLRWFHFEELFVWHLFSDAGFYSESSVELDQYQTSDLNLRWVCFMHYWCHISFFLITAAITWLIDIYLLFLCLYSISLGFLDHNSRSYSWVFSDFSNGLAFLSHCQNWNHRQVAHSRANSVNSSRFWPFFYHQTIDYKNFSKLIYYSDYWHYLISFMTKTSF